MAMGIRLNAKYIWYAFELSDNLSFAPHTWPLKSKLIILENRTENKALDAGICFLFLFFFSLLSFGVFDVN